jgi:hypothetical protein
MNTIQLELNEYQIEILRDAERMKNATLKNKFNKIRNILYEANDNIRIAESVGRDTTVAFTLFGKILNYLCEEKYDDALDCAYQYRAETLNLLINKNTWEKNINYHYG